MESVPANRGGQLPFQKPKWWRTALIIVLGFLLKDVVLKGLAGVMWNLLKAALLR
jgi:hypothetical protein